MIILKKVRDIFILLLLFSPLFSCQNFVKSSNKDGDKNVELSLLLNRNYYLMENGYSCVTMLGDTNFTYQSKIYFDTL